MADNKQASEIRSSETQQRILDAAVEIIETLGTDGLRILDVAETAHVGAPTIYYYYSNRSRLVAAAQAERLTRILRTGDSYMDDITAALASEDREGFINAAARYHEALWGPATTEMTWQILEVISCVRHHAVVMELVAAVIEDHLADRVAVVEAAQQAGWLDASFDARTWANFYFAGCLGRVVVDLAAATAPNGTDARHNLILSFSPQYT